MPFERSDSPAPANTNALVECCYELYRDEYLKAFPSGGDEHDHDDAIHAAVSAVVVEVQQAQTQLTAERLAEAIWDVREHDDPSGPRTGCTEADQSREPIWWKRAVAENLWPASRYDALREAELVLHLLATRESA